MEREALFRLSLEENDRNEIERSAAEARDVILHPIATDRYLNPPSNTPYSLEYAFNLLGDVRGKTILDFGCGSGEKTVVLFRRGAHVIGIDISPEQIDLAKRRTRGEGIAADLRVGSAYNTELPDHSVDVIFCIALVHHLEIPRVQREMHRILREDGYIVLREPMREPFASRRHIVGFGICFRRELMRPITSTHLPPRNSMR